MQIESRKIPYLVSQFNQISFGSSNSFSECQPEKCIVGAGKSIPLVLQSVKNLISETKSSVGNGSFTASLGVNDQNNSGTNPPIMLEIPTIFDSAKFTSESCIHINQILIPGYCSKVGQSNWIATFNSLLSSSYEWGCTDENVLGISKASSTVSKFQPYVIDAILCSG